MDYRAIYESLIERGRCRPTPAGYTETHHVLPRCLGGDDEPTNLVVLTPEEHYLAHQLLVRLHPGNSKIIWAAIAMTEGGRSKGRSTNKLYGWLRRRFSENQRGRAFSEETRAKIGAHSRQRNRGAAHPMFGRKHSAETRAKIAAGNIGKHAGRRREPMSESTRALLSAAQREHHLHSPNAFAGKKHTDEARAKMRAARKARDQTQERAA